MIGVIASESSNVHPGIWSKWYQIAGEQMYMRTFPKMFKNHLLVIGVSSSAWLQELNMIKPGLLKTIAKEIGEGVVTQIRLVLDSDIGKRQKLFKPPPQPRMIEPDISTLPGEITGAADNIEDEALALIIKKAAAANLKK
jgi:hypothetical protein